MFFFLIAEAIAVLKSVLALQICDFNRNLVTKNEKTYKNIFCNVAFHCFEF